MSQRIITLLNISLLLLTSLITPADAADEFPHRAKFPKVATIELESLFQQMDKVVIFDVRSAYEYQTLHIKDARHLSLSSREFITTLQELRKEESRPFVFYCNGHTCSKSYKATKKARERGIENVYAFDAGIFDWTKAHPELAVLLGKSPVNPEALISKEKLKTHMLKPEDFGNRIDGNSIVLDIRDAHQKSGINLFPMHQHSVPLDNKKLEAYVKQARAGGKTLMVYDAVGKQVRWLQYYLEENKVPRYYFMEGGAKAFLNY